MRRAPPALAFLLALLGTFGALVLFSAALGATASAHAPPGVTATHDRDGDGDADGDGISPEPELSVGGSASVSENSVALTYTLSNDGLLPVFNVTVSGELRQGLDTAAPTGRLLSSFDCTLQDAGTDADPLVFVHGLLLLLPGASATCDATIDVAPGSYTAWLSVSGYSLWLATPDATCPAPGDQLCLMTPVSAQAAVPLDLAAPSPSRSPPSSPSPSPSPPQSPSPTATPGRHVQSVPSARPTSVANRYPSPSPPQSPSLTPRPTRSPVPMPTARPSVFMPYAAFVPPEPLPVQSEVPTPLFVLIMILPAAAGAAALLGRRR